MELDKHTFLITDDKIDNESIIEEAAALKAVITRQQLISEGETPSVAGVTVMILSELQEEQDKEIALALQQIENMV